MKQPLYWRLSYELAVKWLQEQGGYIGVPDAGDGSGYYYQWERGGPLEGPFVSLEIAQAEARQEVDPTLAPVSGKFRTG